MDSQRLYERARNVMPGGVNSPVRAFQDMGVSPIVVKRGSGSQLWDYGGRCYQDYVLSWGALILGHAHPRVVEAVCAQTQDGTSYGALCELEIIMAETIKNHISSIDVLRMVSSGTEAVMSALRLCRGYTGRSKILKFDGGYHGHADSMLVQPGSGPLAFALSGSAGVTEEVVCHTLVCPYNDLGAAEAIFKRYGEDIAGVIVEPVAGNMGVVLPQPGFLEGLRDLTRKCGSLLVFDEVITGFRLSLSGYQGVIGISPDLTILGKVIGGGLPLAVYGGKEEVMRRVSPDGPVYQAGTLSGNPLALAAGLAVVRELMRNNHWEKTLEKEAIHLEKTLIEAFQEVDIPVTINRIGSMIGLFFTKGPVEDVHAAKNSDLSLYRAFFRELFLRGVFFPPSPLETIFLSLAHDSEALEKTCEAIQESARALRKIGK